MDQKPKGARFCLYDEAALAEVMARMAAQARALLEGEADPLLLGILRRGDPLAARLQAELEGRWGLAVPRYALKLKRYSDDLQLLHPETLLTENDTLAGRDLARATVLVVDDVLYEGHSLARILAYLQARGAPAVRTAVLADRHCARVPVRADIVGLHLQVAPGDVVECHVPPYEADFKVEVLRPAGR